MAAAAGPEAAASAAAKPADAAAAAAAAAAAREVEDGEVVEGRADGEAGEASDTPAGGAAAPPAKHPLERRWALWFDNPQLRGKGGGGWGTSLRTIHRFHTVEDFWCLFNNVLPPSRLMVKTDMHLFKDGIEPKWEDPVCERGGSWVIPCNRGKDYLDRIWLHTLLALIGEQLEEAEDVCGAVVSIRPGKDRVALWTKSANNEPVQMRIARQLKQILDVNDRIVFQAFSDQKGSRTAPDKYAC